MFEIFSVLDSVVLFVKAAVSPSILSLYVWNGHAFPELSFIIQHLYCML